MTAHVFDWIRTLTFDDLPTPVRPQAQRCLLDTLGVAAGGTETRLARIMAAFVRAQLPGDRPLLFTAGGASPAGAALYGAALVDSLDAHDGQVLTKGHVGAAVIPALLALPGAEGLAGRELLTRIAVGYEIATRAGIALHATARDYHTSGAWNALGVAAVAGRHLGLAADGLAEALGTAEFYGPRSQMMRWIDHPTMVKDGSAWGALAGVSAAFLARDGFTGAPAVSVTGSEVAHYWADLGQRWYILEQYFKPYPVCRWAQPAIEAVRALQARHDLSVAEIDTIVVETFREARHLDTPHPRTTEQAQYSLPWSVACALLTGGVGAGEVAAAALEERERQALAARVEVTESDAFNARFPSERWARVRLFLVDGRVLESAPCQSWGDFERPLDNATLVAKYQALATPCIGAARAVALRESAETLESAESCEHFVALTRLDTASQPSSAPRDPDAVALTPFGR